MVTVVVPTKGNKALANEDTLLRTHCCSWCFLGGQTRGTQNECCVFMLRKLGKICCGHKMFLNKIRNNFLCPGHKICVRNKCCAHRQTGKHLCPQQCVLVCQGLYCRVFTASPFLDQSERETHGDGGGNRAKRAAVLPYFSVHTA